ncbi:MAG: hypothetical protein CMH70_06020 [Nitrosomonadaceae bacterium]|nr:hypothetical protein [Nitrosomonadaceae bacterium]
MLSNPLTPVARFLSWLEIDHAVAYSILEKLWKLVAGITTIFLISIYISPEIQGYYFTFMSILALQALLELGFSVVVVPFASHEWINLSWDGKGPITGEKKSLSRLISLGRLLFKWYLIGGTLFVLTVFSIGYWFFSQDHNLEVVWQGPWFFAVLMTGFQFLVIPFYAMLEGCHQIKNSYLFQLLKTFFSPLLLWLVMILGGDLWMIVAMLTTRLILDLVLIFGRCRNFFWTFIQTTPTTHIHWKSEIWPMQWKISLGAIAGYFMFSIYTPIMFHYHGAATAGQFGMTWQMVEILSALVSAWILPKVPRYSALIAQKKYVELDRHFFRNSTIAVSMAFLGAIAGGVFIYGLNVFEFQLAERLLSPLPTFLLLAAVTLIQIPNCISNYLYSHKQNPLVWLHVGFGFLNGLLVWLLGSNFGPLGASASYLATVALVLLPGEIIIFNKCRREWHL